MAAAEIKADLSGTQKDLQRIKENGATSNSVPNAGYIKKEKKKERNTKEIQENETDPFPQQRGQEAKIANQEQQADKTKEISNVSTDPTRDNNYSGDEEGQSRRNDVHLIQSTETSQQKRRPGKGHRSKQRSNRRNTSTTGSSQPGDNNPPESTEPMTNSDPSAPSATSTKRSSERADTAGSGHYSSEPASHGRSKSTPPSNDDPTLHQQVEERPSRSPFPEIPRDIRVCFPQHGQINDRSSPSQNVQQVITPRWNLQTSDHAAVSLEDPAPCISLGHNENQQPVTTDRLQNASRPASLPCKRRILNLRVCGSLEDSYEICNDSQVFDVQSGIVQQDARDLGDRSGEVLALSDIQLFVNENQPSSGVQDEFLAGLSQPLNNPSDQLFAVMIRCYGWGREDHQLRPHLCQRCRARRPNVMFFQCHHILCSVCLRECRVCPRCGQHRHVVFDPDYAE